MVRLYSDFQWSSSPSLCSISLLHIAYTRDHASMIFVLSCRLFLTLAVDQRCNIHHAIAYSRNKVIWQFFITSFIGGARCHFERMPTWSWQWFKRTSMSRSTVKRTMAPSSILAGPWAHLFGTYFQHQHQVDASLIDFHNHTEHHCLWNLSLHSVGLGSSTKSLWPIYKGNLQKTFYLFLR